MSDDSNGDSFDSYSKESTSKGGRNLSSFLSFRHLNVYETPREFILIGCSSEQRRFSVLRIDRTVADRLLLIGDRRQFNQSEIDTLLSHILNVERQQQLQSNEQPQQQPTNLGQSPQLTLRLRASGLLGFVRFLEGYYMILVTKVCPMAQLGYHVLYKVEDTLMVYIPNLELPSCKMSNVVEEQRYLKMFQLVDLSANFYFSYTYDVTHSLQENVLRSYCHCRRLQNKGDNENDYEWKFVWNTYLLEPFLIQFGQNTSNNRIGGVGNQLDRRFLLPIMHGFLGVRTFRVYSNVYTLLLIARRSRKYAGTRFLKRGANVFGDVANEIETEQILFANHVPAFDRGFYTAFVQHRGSVPLIWSQDQSKMVAKPQIELGVRDPFAAVAGRHFAWMLRKYGTPALVLNLLKRRERRKHESILGGEFRQAIVYLNQFLEPERNIQYLSFDMARANKQGIVLRKLEDIGHFVVEQNGWYQSFRPYFCHKIRPGPLEIKRKELVLLNSNDENNNLIELDNSGGRVIQIQRGVCRSNCVDCLDRTNTAQFVLGKVALGYQLYALGASESPTLNIDTEICAALERLYELLGDTLAMQYAGSQLVHNVQSYKKTSSAFQERSRDVIQTLNRYYSSTFSDADKQMAMNLFLGVYRPLDCLGKVPPLWELLTDSYLHNTITSQFDLNNSYCAWFDIPEANRSSSPENKFRNLPLIPLMTSSASSTSLMMANDSQMTSFDVVLQSVPRPLPLYSLTARCTVQAGLLGKLLGKRQPHQVVEEIRNEKLGEMSRKQQHTSAAGGEEVQSSSDEEDNDSKDDELPSNLGIGGISLSKFSVSNPSMSASSTTASQTDESATIQKQEFYNRFPTTSSVYGFSLCDPTGADFQRYAQFAVLALQPEARMGGAVSKCGRFQRVSPDVELDHSYSHASTDYSAHFWPHLAKLSYKLHSLAIYRQSVGCAVNGPRLPSEKDMRMYREHVAGLHKFA